MIIKNEKDLITLAHNLLKESQSIQPLNERPQFTFMEALAVAVQIYDAQLKVSAVINLSNK